MTDTNPMSRRKFLQTSTIVATGIGLSGVAGFIYSYQLEPSFLTLSNITVPIHNLPEAFEGYRIAQISDIHFDTWMNQERLSRVIQLVNQQAPDLITITGDYVTHGNVEEWINELAEPLSQLTASDGVLTVLGNHDHWTNPFFIREMLKSANINELKNDSIVIERDGGKLAIGGVDDVWERKADLDQVLRSLPEAEIPAILLAHEPDFADLSAESGRFALQLSGHSHGGQVRFPLIGAPILPRLGRKYPIGQYQVRDMIQYTNRGVGMVRPTFRFGCPPEVAVFTLTQTI